MKGNKRPTDCEGRAKVLCSLMPRFSMQQMKEKNG